MLGLDYRETDNRAMGVMVMQKLSHVANGNAACSKERQYTSIRGARFFSLTTGYRVV